jgi:hypothetical protein
MFEKIPENRQSGASAAWCLHISRPRSLRVGRFASVFRMNDARTLGQNSSVRRFSDGQSPGEPAPNRLRQMSSRLAVWVLQIGEKLARWRLAFINYPLDRDN